MIAVVVRAGAASGLAPGLPVLPLAGIAGGMALVLVSGSGGSGAVSGRWSLVAPRSTDATLRAAALAEAADKIEEYRQVAELWRETVQDADKSTLAFEIERWDKSAGLLEAWVKTDLSDNQTTAIPLSSTVDQRRRGDRVTS